MWAINSMVECLLDSQDTGVRFPYRLPIFLYFCMTFQGTFSRRNLHGSEKIQDDAGHSGIHKPRNHPPHQIITVNGNDYFVRKADGNFSDDARLNQFNNKTVQVDGTFIGPVFLITSIVKVGP